MKVLVIGGVAAGTKTAAKFAALTGVTVFTGREAVCLDSNSKTVQAKNLETNETEVYSYERLVIAVGASAAVPPVEGIDKKGVFKLRTPDDAVTMRSYIEENNVKSDNLFQSTPFFHKSNLKVVVFAQIVFIIE